MGQLLSFEQGQLCSGTLIGCNTFLTSAECFLSLDPDPTDFVVFFQHAGVFSVESIELHPDWTGSIAGPGNVAVAKLLFPVNGVRPRPINTIGRPPAGTDAAIVGFGSTGGLDFPGMGIKRAGLVTTATCNPPFFADSEVCWSLQAPLGPAGEDSGACVGDGGGPLLLDPVSGDPVVAGIHSRLTAGNNCLADTGNAGTDVYVARQWIQSVGGTDLNATSCGATGQVGDSNSLVAAEDSRLETNEVDKLFEFEVPAGAAALRVTVNIAQGDGDFHLYVRRGEAPSLDPFIADCFSITSGNVPENCSVTQPEAGTWYALVRRIDGSGDFQITATVLAPSRRHHRRRRLLPHRRLRRPRRRLLRLRPARPAPSPACAASASPACSTAASRSR